MIVMYAVAAVLGAAALALLLGLRESSERARYARLIAGTMAAAGSFLLFVFATALWMWSSAP